MKKKLFSLLLIAVMVLSSFSAVFADDTVKLEVEGVEGHTYTSYQLLVGDLAENGKLSNVKWGSDVADSITYGTKTIAPVAGQEVPADVLEYLVGLENGSQDTADALSSWVKGNGTTIPAAGLQVPTGYYVIKDAYTDASAPQTTTISTVMCKVVGPTKVTPKAGTTEHKKEVLDVNDSKATLNFDNLIGTDGWDKSADHDFGDAVPFKLTTKIASDFAKYDKYFLKVSDKLGNGLTLNSDSIKVYVNGQLATEGEADGQYKKTVNGQTFEIEFGKLNANTNAAAGRDVVIVYTATLNESAVVGNPGNLNESYAEFSNNPNDNQNGKGKTPTDTAVVFTFKYDVDKIDGKYNDLPKAGFTLYKKYDSAQTGKTNVAGTTPEGAEATTFPAGEFWYAVKTIAPSDTTTNFEFKGIDDGEYCLVESATPEGYNTMKPVKFEVTATHGADGESATGYAIKTLEAGSEFTGSVNGGTIERKKADTTHTAVTGEVYGEIINNEGSTLPETGGMGTTIIYILGAALVIGAGVVLVSRKKVDNR